MKVLVTGANGFLGRGIVDNLIKLGHKVIATDFSVDLVNDKAKKIEGDIFLIENPYEFFEKPDVILHLAWRDGFVHDSPAHIDDLAKHYNFLKAFAEAGINKIAVMGTMHEIGFHEGSIDESTPCNPLTLYGISKDALRKLTFKLAKQNEIDVQWLRAYYIVSNTAYGSSIFSKIFDSAQKGQKEFPFTMGQNQYDFLDYEDFCLRIAAATQSKETGIINICSGRPEKLADRVERFIKENDLDIKLQYGVFPDRPYDSKAIWGDSRKIDEIMKGIL